MRTLLGSAVVSLFLVASCSSGDSSSSGDSVVPTQVGGGSAGAGGSGTGGSAHAGAAGASAGASGTGGHAGNAGSAGGTLGGTGGGGTSGHAGSGGASTGGAGSGGASGNSGATSGHGGSAGVSGGAGSGGAGAPSCDASQMLCAGVCVTTTSCTFAVTSAEPAQGFQNGGGWVKLHGAGFANGASVMIGDGKAPAKVLDATTIMIQTPPGPLGLQDVTVTLGAMTTTLPGGFTYQSGDLSPPWTQKNLTMSRGLGTSMAVLQDGRVLLVGGLSGLTWDTALDSLDLYTEPQESAVAAANAMSTPRWIASAVTLLSGKVVIVGGACQYSSAGATCMGDPKSVDLFDPATNTITPSAASLTENFMVTLGVLLPDGRALFIANSSNIAHIYDPETDSFKTVTTLVPGPNNLSYPFMTRLRDGRVLIGSDDTSGTSAPGNYVWLFDPSTDTFTPTGGFVTPRSGATAATLPDGRVIVVGGNSNDPGLPSLDSIELYDPTAGTFAVAPYKLTVPRQGHASVLVRDGTLLSVAGISDSGEGDCTTAHAWTNTVDQIDPVKGTVTAFSPLAQAVEGIVGVATLDGSVVVAGGAQCGVMPLPFIDFLEGKP